MPHFYSVIVFLYEIYYLAVIVLIFGELSNSTSVSLCVKSLVHVCKYNYDILARILNSPCTDRFCLNYCLNY